MAFAKGDPSQLLPTNDLVNKYAINEGQGWFTDAVAQAKMDKGLYLTHLHYACYEHTFICLIDILIGTVAAAVLLGFAWIQLMKMFTKEFI